MPHRRYHLEALICYQFLCRLRFFWCIFYCTFWLYRSETWEHKGSSIILLPSASYTHTGMDTVSAVLFIAFFNSWPKKGSTSSLCKHSLTLQRQKKLSVLSKKFRQVRRQHIPSFSAWAIHRGEKKKSCTEPFWTSFIKRYQSNSASRDGFQPIPKYYPPAPTPRVTTHLICQRWNRAGEKRVSEPVKAIKLDLNGGR